MTITAGAVKELREKTGAGMMDCKKALSESEGDFEKAIEYLRKKGIAKASKKAGRATNEGLVTSYIHAGGKIGVMVEVACETDFVARNEKFQDFTRDIAMHIAAASPRWLDPESVPDSVQAKEKEIFIAQMKEEGKPDNVIEKIADGKMKKFFTENCLLSQDFVKDPNKKVADVISEAVATIGENIAVRRFVRFGLGEDPVVEAGAN